MRPKDRPQRLLDLYRTLETAEAAGWVSGSAAAASRRFFAGIAVQLGTWLPEFTLDESNGGVRISFRSEERQVCLGWLEDGAPIEPTFRSWNGDQPLRMAPEVIADALLNLPGFSEDEVDWAESRKPIVAGG